MIIWAGNLHMKSAKEIKKKQTTSEIKVTVSNASGDLLRKFQDEQDFENEMGQERISLVPGQEDQ